MPGEGSAADCRERKKIRLFLDDLLDEKDYRETGSHLEACAFCQNLAAASGSLSYAVKLLGQVKTPDGLFDHVMYRMQKGEKKASMTIPDPKEIGPASPAGGSVFRDRAILVGGVVVLVLGLAFGYLFGYASGLKEIIFKQTDSREGNAVVKNAAPPNADVEGEDESLQARVSVQFDE